MGLARLAGIIRLWQSLLLVLVSVVCVSPAGAEIVISGTRVVYNSSDHEVSLKVSNVGSQPSLLQTWADKGNAGSTPDTADAPFLIMPPIARVDPGKSQTLRITYTGDDVPQDRESVYWLNILDVPPLPKAKGDADSKNFVQVVFRSRIKIFYRPANLPGSADGAASSVSWELLKADGKYVLRGKNDSAYCVSVNKLQLANGDHVFSHDGLTILPRSFTDFVLKDMTQKRPGPVILHYETINDYGAVLPHSATL